MVQQEDVCFHLKAREKTLPRIKHSLLMMTVNGSSDPKSAVVLMPVPILLLVFRMCGG